MRTAVFLVSSLFFVGSASAADCCPQPFCEAVLPVRERVVEKKVVRTTIQKSFSNRVVKIKRFRCRRPLLGLRCRKF